MNIDSLNWHTYREICQQPTLWQDTYSIIAEKEKEISDFMSEFYDDDVIIIFTGAGTSSFIGNIMTFMLPKQKIYNIKSVPTTDIATHPNTFFQKNKKYILVSLARSGNSPESIAAVDRANSICEKNISHIVITCNDSGELAKKTVNKNALLLILPPDTNDKGLAMTSSFTSMLLASMLIFDIKKISLKKNEIDRLSGKGEFMITGYADLIFKIASSEFQRAVFLGSGERKGIAEECHLKLQELTDGKVTCLFDSFLGFRHGPKAAINEKTVLVYLLSDDEKIFRYERDLILQINRQVKPAIQIYVAQSKKQIDNIEFDLEMIPEKYDQTAYDVILYVLIGQLLGLFKSIDLNLDPDNPSESGKISRVVEGVTIY